MVGGGVVVVVEMMGIYSGGRNAHNERGRNGNGDSGGGHGSSNQA